VVAGILCVCERVSVYQDGYAASGTLVLAAAALLVQHVAERGLPASKVIERAGLLHYHVHAMQETSNWSLPAECELHLLCA
jgi:hypothetical protein